MRRETFSKAFNAFFQKIILFAEQKHLAVLAVSAVLLVFALFKLSTIKLELDLYDILDTSLKSSRNQWIMRQEFVDINSIFVSLYSNETLSQEDVCKIKRFAISYYNDSGELAKVVAPWNIRTPRKEQDKIWYRPYVQDPCLAPDSQPVHEEFSKFKDTPWDFFFRGKNPDQVSLEVVFKDSVGENGEKKFDVIAIDRFAKSLGAFVRTQTPKIKYHIFGHVSFRWHIMQTLKKDFIWNIAILVFFAVFFFLFLGTWRAGLYYVVILVFTELMLFGCMSWLGFPIDLMTNCLILMTSVAGVSDFLYVSSAQETHQHWIDSFKNVITPSFFTSFTTVCGFLSLGLSEIPLIARFGMAAAIGATFQWLATFVLLPAFLKAVPMKKHWVRPKAYLYINSEWFLKINRIAPNRFWTALLMALALIGAYGMTQLNVGDDILKNFPEEHAVTKAYQWLRNDKDWQGQLFLLIQPEVPQAEAVSLLQKISQLKAVAHLENPIEIENFLTHDLSPNDGSLVLREMSLGFLKRYRSLNDYLRAPIYTNSLALPVLRNLVSQVENICESRCALAGQTMVYLEYSDRISRTLIDSMGSSLLTVVLLVLGLAWLQGHKSSLSLTLSSIWSPLIMLGFLWWTQLPVTSMTAIFFAVIVGLTGDNAIQYLFASEDILEGAEKRASASLMQMILFCCCSLFFVMHTFVPMKILGLLFVVGFFMTYIGDLWVLRGLLLFSRKK